MPNGYSIFNGSLPSGSSGASGEPDVNVCIQFEITQSGYQLSGYYWYLPPGGDTAGSNQSFALWATTNGTSGIEVSNSAVTGSGTWTADAWNYTALPSAVQLANGTAYIAGCFTTSGYVEYLYNYWSTGAGDNGITNGPVTAPSASAALGGNQQSYNYTSSLAFPNGSYEASFYGIDINITPIPGSGSGLLMMGIM